MALRTSQVDRLFSAIVLVALCFVAPAVARPVPETSAKQAILIDLWSDTVLLEKNADTLVPPSSMTKLMTVYLLFERVKSGRITLDDRFAVSKKAWRMGGSKMFVPLGKRVRVEDLIRGIIVQSGNDASIVVAEALAGSEAAFARQMTRRARQLGMAKSTFKNANGWPAPGHLMTVREIALLARRLIEHFPRYYHYYAERSFSFAGQTQRNRNPLLAAVRGADGLKTGHTKSGGYGLAGSARRAGRRLILVVNGLASKQARKTESRRLMRWGFSAFERITLFKTGQVVASARTWMGRSATVPLALTEDVRLTVPRGGRKDLRVSASYVGPIPAPLRRGQEIARLEVAGANGLVRSYKLVAAADVERQGLFGRLRTAAERLLGLAP